MEPTYSAANVKKGLLIVTADDIDGEDSNRSQIPDAAHAAVILSDAAPCNRVAAIYQHGFVAQMPLPRSNGHQVDNAPDHMQSLYA